MTLPAAGWPIEASTGSVNERDPRCPSQTRRGALVRRQPAGTPCGIRDDRRRDLNGANKLDVPGLTLTSVARGQRPTLDVRPWVHERPVRIRYAHTGALVTLATFRHRQ
jgi:hypothetical protein